MLKKCRIGENYYVSESGEVFRKLKPSINNRGYEVIGINHQFIMVHKLIYETFNNEMTKGYDINHIDGNKLNNSINNLECVTHRNNCQCQNKTRNNKTGVSNINYNKRNNKYAVAFAINNKVESFGQYSTLDEANIIRDVVNDKIINKEYINKEEIIPIKEIKNNTGLKHICKRKNNTYSVCIRYKKKTYTNTFCVLENAIIWRDTTLLTIKCK